MMYTEFNVGGREYRLRLNTRAIVALEKKLGCNPLAIFGDGDTIPPVTAMIAILHAALQPLNHGITEMDAMDIFDDFLEENQYVLRKICMCVYRLIISVCVN